MVLLKVRHPMTDDEAVAENYLKNVLHYLIDDRAITIGMDGLTTVWKNKWIGQNRNAWQNEIFHEIMYVRDYFNRKRGNPTLHIIVSFDSQLSDIKMVKMYAAGIAYFFADRHQYLYVIHRKQRYDRVSFHMHILVNAVSYMDGKVLESDMSFLYRFRDYISRVTGDRVRFTKANDFEEEQEMRTYGRVDWDNVDMW